MFLYLNINLYKFILFNEIRLEHLSIGNYGAKLVSDILKKNMILRNVK